MSPTYLTVLKTALVEGIKVVFDQDYPEPDFRGIHASIEYPVEQTDYPGIWVDYSDTAALQIAGIHHREKGPVSADGTSQRIFTRWKFTGYASFTVVALTSLERDRLYDEIVRVMAFGQDVDNVSDFRNYVESNDLVAMNFDFDQIEVGGNAAAPGTPWGTDDIVYERSINMEVIGEFVSDGKTRSLVPLSSIVTYPYVPTVEENPAPGVGDDGYPATGVALTTWQ